MIEFIFEKGIYVILVIGAVFLTLGCLLVIRLKTEKARKIELIVEILAAVSVVLVAYNLILSTESNKRIEENRIAHITLENIQRNWLSPQIELSALYPESYFLYRSITPDSDYCQLEPEYYDPARRKQIEIAYSFRIFQAMEDFLTIGSRDVTGKYVWINNFLMWMQSPILREHWNRVSFNFSKDTREMINRLIIESDALMARRALLGKLMPEDYDSVACRFVVHFRMSSYGNEAIQ